MPAEAPRLQTTDCYPCDDYVPCLRCPNNEDRPERVIPARVCPLEKFVNSLPARGYLESETQRARKLGLKPWEPWDAGDHLQLDIECSHRQSGEEGGSVGVEQEKY